MVAKDSNEKRPFKPQIYKNKGQSRSYTQGGYQNRILGQTVETEDSMEIVSLGKTTEKIIFEGTLGDMEDKIVGENIEMIAIMTIIEGGIGQEKGHLQEVMVLIGIEVLVKVDQGQDLELIQIEIE